MTRVQTVALTLAGSLVVVLGLSGSVTRVSAQQAMQAASGGSLADVANEIRLLRATLEEATKAQTLSASLAAQQGRTKAITARLDSARKDYETAAAQVVTQVAAIANTDLRQAGPAERPYLERSIALSRSALDVLQMQEQSARSRMTELAQDLQREEAMWSDLLARLKR